LSSLNFLFTQRQLQIYTQYRTHWSGCIWKSIMGATVGSRVCERSGARGYGREQSMWAGWSDPNLTGALERDSLRLERRPSRPLQFRSSSAHFTSSGHARPSMHL
jgi:hypothetical protein